MWHCTDINQIHPLHCCLHQMVLFYRIVHPLPYLHNSLTSVEWGVPPPPLGGGRSAPHLLTAAHDINPSVHRCQLLTSLSFTSKLTVFSKDTISRTTGGSCWHTGSFKTGPRVQLGHSFLRAEWKVLLMTPSHALVVILRQYMMWKWLFQYSKR